MEDIVATVLKKNKGDGPQQLIDNSDNSLNKVVIIRLKQHFEAQNPILSCYRIRIRNHIF